MEKLQSKTSQIVLTVIGMVALLAKFLLNTQEPYLIEKETMLRFIGFACLAGANYLNYKRLLVTDASKAKPILWLSILLGFIALATISRIFI